MTSARVLEKQSSAPDRRPAAAATLGPVSAHPVSAARALQSRLGNRGVLAMMAGECAAAPLAVGSQSIAPAAAPLHVSSPSDPAEREATTTASAVMRMAAPASITAAAQTVQRAASSGSGGGVAPPAVTAGVGAAMSGGAPLAKGVRGFMEPRFGANFGGVRVHTGEQAATLSHQLGAKAFTVGSHIFFGRNQYQPDRADGRELIAHELTHTIQQGGGAARSIQRDEAPQEDHWWSGLSAEGLAKSAVRRLAPGLEPVLSGGGVGAWLESHAMGALEAMVSKLLPTSVQNAGREVAAAFGPMVATLQQAAVQISKNDCTPLAQAADKLEKTALKLITPIVEKVQPVVAAVKEFLDLVWTKIGAPVWNWIQEYAAEQWKMITDLADLAASAVNWLWENTKKGIALQMQLFGKAWDWLKAKLGLAAQESGAGGLLDWIKTKLSQVWEAAKAKFAPVVEKLKGIGLAAGALLLAVSPVGPIMAVAGAAAAAMPGLKWLYANWGKGNFIVTARAYIQQTLIPPLLTAAQQLGQAINGAAAAITGALNKVVTSLAAASASLGNGLFAFAASAVQWVAAQVNALAAWATGELAQAGDWLNGALDGLQSFLTRIQKFLGRVADVVIDIYGLPILLAEEVWNRVPPCIRDPIVDFLGPIILSQIELFQELVKDDKAWQQTKEDIHKIIKQVFHDHDLVGAVKSAFDLILRVFKLPKEALAAVAQKAASAWDVVSKHPLEFLKNTIRALGVGFKLLWADKYENLKLGLRGWLLGEIKDLNILIPKDWTNLKQMFDFVASVLGVNVAHVLELVKKKFPDAPIDKIQQWIGRVVGVVAWADKAFDVTKTPNENAQGIVDQAKDFAKSLMTSLAEWVAGKVAEEVAKVAAAAAASAGLSEIVDVARRVYKVLLTIQRWADRVLAMANQALDNVLDLANGAVDKVGQVFLGLMQRGMPVIIGLLAEQVGLGDVAQGVRDAITKLRANVDKGIEWVLDKLKAGLEVLINLVKKGAKAISDWWKEPVKFTDTDGKPHSVFFEGTDGSLDVIVQSKRSRVEQLLMDIVADQSLKPKHPKANQALTHYRTNIKPHLKVKADAQRQKKLPEALADLSKFLNELMGVTNADLPNQDQPDYQAPDHSKMFKITPKNRKAGTNAGGDTTAMTLVTLYGSRKKGGSTSWVRMHMITAGVGGPGTPNNWVPAPTAVNTGGTVRDFEKNLEDLVAKDNPATKKPNVVWVHVRTEAYHDKFDDPDKIVSYSAKAYPKSVRFEAGLYYPEDAKTWRQDSKAMLGTRAEIPSPKDELVGEALNVNTASVGQLAQAADISDWFAQEVIDERTAHGPYVNRQNLRKRVKEARARQTDKFDQFYNALEAALTAGKLRLSRP